MRSLEQILREMTVKERVAKALAIEPLRTSADPPPELLRERWLVFIFREGGQLDTTFILSDDEREARERFDALSPAWSDSYLCKIVKGPIT